MLCRRRLLSVYRTCSTTREPRSASKTRSSAGEHLRPTGQVCSSHSLLHSISPSLSPPLSPSPSLLHFSSKGAATKPVGFGVDSFFAASLTLSSVCRALEASLAERQGVLQHVGLSLTGISVDPLNPHERKRQGHNPVGLKNIGNTCWFSAVIQVHVHCTCQHLYITGTT